MRYVSARRRRPPALTLQHSRGTTTSSRYSQAARTAALWYCRPSRPCQPSISHSNTRKNQARKKDVGQERQERRSNGRIRGEATQRNPKRRPTTAAAATSVRAPRAACGTERPGDWHEGAAPPATRAPCRCHDAQTAAQIRQHAHVHDVDSAVGTAVHFDVDGEAHLLQRRCTPHHMVCKVERRAGRCHQRVHRGVASIHSQE